MSKTTTWLIVIFDDSVEEEAWFTDPLFDEEHVNFELAALHISNEPGKRERHLRFKLELPLTTEQLQGLKKLKDLGLFYRYYFVDEIVTCRKRA